MAGFQAQVKGDRTAQAIARQLKAMGCDRYDIGIRDAASGKMMNREWSAAEVLQNTPWLKRMNAQGNDVYIRPAEQERHGLVLVDDLIATGGTIKAAAELCEELGGEVVKMLFLIELAGLHARDKLKKYDVTSVICYDGK